MAHVAWDLFAGTGALGLEALSRGAAHVTFVDNNLAAVQQIKHVLTRFGADNADVLHSDVTRGLSAPALPYDIVFLDPPFGLDYVSFACSFIA